MPKKFKQFLGDVHEQRIDIAKPFQDHGEGIIPPGADFTPTAHIPKLRPDTPNQERNQRRLKRDAHAAQQNFQLAAAQNASAPAAQPEPKKQDTGAWAIMKALGGGLVDLLRREDLNVSEVDALSEQQTQMEETNMGIREKLLAVLHEDRAQHNKGAVPAESHDEKEKSSKGATEMKQPAKDAAADPVDIVSQGHEDASKAGRVTAPAPGRNSADGVRSGDQQIIPSATPQKALASTMEAYKSMYAPVEEEVELMDESAKEKKAIKDLMRRALGAKKLQAGYTSAVADNGDFVVYDKYQKIVGRIKKGEFDPSSIGESVEVSEESVQTMVEGMNRFSHGPYKSEMMNDKLGAAKAEHGLGIHTRPGTHESHNPAEEGKDVTYFHPRSGMERKGKVVKTENRHYHIKDHGNGEIHKFEYHTHDNERNFVSSKAWRKRL